VKEKIIDAALQQFLEQGIQKVTMQKLAVHFGISIKTIYAYFPDKEELVEECLRLFYQETDEQLLGLIKGAPNALVSICQAYSKIIDLEFGRNYLINQDLNYYYPKLQDKALSEYGKGAFEILTGIINRAMDEGYFTPFLTPYVVLESLSVIFRSVTRYEAYKDFDKKAALVKRNMGAYIKSICTEKGVQEMDRLNLLT